MVGSIFSFAMASVSNVPSTKLNIRPEPPSMAQEFLLVLIA
jgi:hypothetical protein